MGTITETILAEALRGILPIAQAETSRLHKVMEEARLDENLYRELAGQSVDHAYLAGLVSTTKSTRETWAEAQAALSVAEAALDKLGRPVEGGAAETIIPMAVRAMAQRKAVAGSLPTRFKVEVTHACDNCGSTEGMGEDETLCTTCMGKAMRGPEVKS
jgi:hypothetical protein